MRAAPNSILHVALLLTIGLLAGAAHAQVPPAEASLPELGSYDPAVQVYTGQRILRIEVVPVGRWLKSVRLPKWPQTDELFSTQLVRRILGQLLDTGKLARAQADIISGDGGVVLRFRVEPRGVIARARVRGTPLGEAEVLDAVGIKSGHEVADQDLDEYIQKLGALHVERGYPSSEVKLDVLLTDDPLAVVLLFEVVPGAPTPILQRRFRVHPNPPLPGLSALLDAYSVQSGQRTDEVALKAADRELQEELRMQGWHRAVVGHRAVPIQGGTRLDVDVNAGPHVHIAFEGHRVFDASQLTDALELEENPDRSDHSLMDRLTRHYVAHGFLDTEITVRRDGERAAEERLVFVVHEGQRVRVAAREYPCLTGARTPREVGEEIDSFLSELLPGSEPLGPVDSRKLDPQLGPTGTTGARPLPYEANPWDTYDSTVYDRAMKHVQDLYRNEGYLSATVGPAQLLRRRCDGDSPAGSCRAQGPLRRPPTACSYDDVGLPLPEPSPDPVFGCVSDREHSITCEPTAVLHVPVKLGPRSYLWDVAFEGNQRITEQHLAEVAELELGQPLSMAAVEQARRRILDEYAEDGFAYAETTTHVDFSPDRTRAKVRFTLHEGERVRVAAILVQGARRTSERLIRARIELKPGKPYRRSQVRDTEEQLAMLGVFSTVNVTLEDPYVPARRKNVIVTVVERDPQYFEGRPGFSTGEGFRLSLEYGHLNVASEAIQLTMRAQLGYLPNQLILEPDVRKKYVKEVDTIAERLERRLSLGAAFPDVGLGARFRLGVEGFDVHDNARDFGLTKDAGVVTLSYLLSRRLTLQLGTSVERNDVVIFGADQKGALLDYVRENPNRANVFRVPEGTSRAIAQRFTVSWDRRDIPLGATRGTLVTSSLEHVTAQPLGESAGGADASANPFAATDSEFLRWTSRLAAYAPLGHRGVSVAVSMRWGINQQLRSGSRTYPDRLFFLGGIDSIRGFLQDSLIPDDVAAQLLDPQTNLEVRQVVIRGGNFFVNPRAELRIPMGSSLQTALFLDAGNLWSRSPTEGIATGLERRYRPKYWRLRYAIGTGLRINTPVGPLVFDYGFNVERILDRIWKSRSEQRYWEDLGAFHFSIGLF